MNSNTAPNGRQLDCLTCGRSFRATGYDGVMEWATHICQPMTMLHDASAGPNRYEPFTVLAHSGNAIEYRYACKLPDRPVEKKV